MSDGTRVSVPNLQLLLGADGANACVPVLVPLYAGKLGGFGFLLWLSADGTATVTALSEWDASASPSAPFVAGLTCVDAGPLTVPPDGTYTLTYNVAAVPATMDGRAVRMDLLPLGLAVACASGKWSAARDNAAALKVSRAARTGLFNGSFNLFTENGARLRKTVVPLYGVIVNGVGYGAAVVKKVGSASFIIQ